MINSNISVPKPNFKSSPSNLLKQNGRQIDGKFRRTIICSLTTKDLTKFNLKDLTKFNFCA